MDRIQRLNEIREETGAETFWLRYGGSGAEEEENPEQYAATVWNERYSETFIELFEDLEHFPYDSDTIYDLDSKRKWDVRVSRSLVPVPS